MQDLVRYTKSSSISTSHVHLYDAESVFPLLAQYLRLVLFNFFSIFAGSAPEPENRGRFLYLSQKNEKSIYFKSQVLTMKCHSIFACTCMMLIMYKIFKNGFIVPKM